MFILFLEKKLIETIFIALEQSQSPAELIDKCADY